MYLKYLGNGRDRRIEIERNLTASLDGVIKYQTVLVTIARTTSRSRV